MQKERRILIFERAELVTLYHDEYMGFAGRSNEDFLLYMVTKHIWKTREAPECIESIVVYNEFSESSFFIVRNINGGWTSLGPKYYLPYSEIEYIIQNYKQVNGQKSTSI